jgi:thiol-disulfide isomerase/thioredoxin
MPTAPHTDDTDLLVACLCADWCGTCRDYQATFDQAKALYPGARFLWIDVEEAAELVDPIEIENFPTLLIARRDQAMFFGTVTPHAETLQRLIRTRTLADAPALPASDDGHGLAQRLWQQEIYNK